jgi:ADP-heptose:LPS heptosyltransferase
MDAEAVKAFLAAFLAGSRLRVVLIGTGDDEQESSPRITNLIGRTSLSELVAILRNARFVVSVDSGPMHLAAALGAPLLSIHTWSDPRLVGPYSETSWIWQGGEIRRQNLAAAPLAEKPFRSSDAIEVGTFSAAVSR